MMRAGGGPRILRSAWRSTYLLLLLVAATIDGRLLTRPRCGAEGAIWIHGWCRRIVEAMQIECTIEGGLPTGGVVVSNHLSYLDILLYSAATPFIMVAKREVRNWPLLGWLTAQAGTVYVQRSEDPVPPGGRQTRTQVNEMMANAYASGLPVLFFPEGTTTGGDQVLPFRRGLFHSVLNGDVSLRVSALHLGLGLGNGSATLADDVCFVGDALFGPHIFGCLGLHGITARIHFGDEIVTRNDRFVLSENARDAVIELYGHLADGALEKAAHQYEGGLLEAV